MKGFEYLSVDSAILKRYQEITGNPATEFAGEIDAVRLKAVWDMSRRYEEQIQVSTIPAAPPAVNAGALVIYDAPMQEVLNDAKAIRVDNFNFRIENVTLNWQVNMIVSLRIRSGADFFERGMGSYFFSTANGDEFHRYDQPNLTILKDGRFWDSEASAFRPVDEFVGFTLTADSFAATGTGRLNELTLGISLLY